MISLPAIIFGPVRYPIGYVNCVLRPPEEAEVLSESEFARKGGGPDRLLELSNGEKVIVASRKKLSLPGGVDGALTEESDGTYRWIAHRLLTAYAERVGEVGLAQCSADTAASWNGLFSFKAEITDHEGKIKEGSEGLRPPQLGALHAVGAHWSISKQPATVVMPTGTGKTETMLSTLAAFCASPMLVIVPSEALRNQTMRKFLTFGLLRKLKVLNAAAKNPVVGYVTKRPKSASDLAIFGDCNVILATMSAVGDGKALQFASAISGMVRVLVVDEAHHLGAPGWGKFREAFDGVPVLQFTATPFRRDGRIVDGSVIYSYPLRKAQEDGYFRPIDFCPIYEIDESNADRSIAEAAVEKLRQDLRNGFDHLLMARCVSIERATAIHAIYAEIARDMAPLMVHSEARDAFADLERLRSGQSRIVVCVNMLGEGFDLPQLKIAAIHDLHKSLAILLQFAGRFTRSSGERIGRATVIANIADMNVSSALERLYSEDADWNVLLSEMSSNAAKEHSRLIGFMKKSQRLGETGDGDDNSISHFLLHPPLSTLAYECADFSPKRFHTALPKALSVRAAWLSESDNTLFFVTRSEPSVRWSRSKSLLDRKWDLFVIHFDGMQKLMYVSSTDHSTPHEKLAQAMGATRMLSGDVIFRALGKINRLLFQSIGVKKHGRRNLRYAMYTGADVAEALSMTERAGSVKSNLSGNGWEDGRRVSIGCSYKGRVWTVEQGTILELTDWCEKVGQKLRDTSIDPDKIIEHVLIPEELTAFPDKLVLSVEWPVEMLGQSESRITFLKAGAEYPMCLTELRFVEFDAKQGVLRFDLVDSVEAAITSLSLTLDETDGFRVVSSQDVTIRNGKLESELGSYLSDYPPLVRFVDLTEVDGNLYVAPKHVQKHLVPPQSFESWDWAGVDRTKESYWKDEAERIDSVQWRAAREFIAKGYSFVFDDDSAGEAADLVCINEEDDHIRLALVHCKFSGGADAGQRVKDVVEVCSQATRSAKWKWKFVDLCKHILSRNERLAKDRPSRCLNGSITQLNKFVRACRLKEVRVEVYIVQPGLSQKSHTDEQAAVLGAAASYLKETIGVDLRIVCDE